jgi:hypothetical protein
MTVDTPHPFDLQTLFIMGSVLLAVVALIVLAVIVLVTTSRKRPE